MSENLFKRAYKKYRSFLSKKEAIIQSNLFVDYFVQSVGVHNVSNDILCGENSIEMRSLFMNPNIIKFALNLPINSKINLKEKNKHFILKPILNITNSRNDKRLAYYDGTQSIIDLQLKIDCFTIMSNITKFIVVCMI